MKNDYKDYILKRTREMEDWIIANRRKFHRHPEASMEEHWTTDEICKTLDEWGIPYERFADMPGVLAYVKGAHPGKTVALRSDIDALSVLQKNDVEYKSEIEGFMHACGHDAHLTMNLAAAKILNEIKDDLHGTVVHIFQPAEEIAQGAKRIIAQGDWFDKVDNVFGAHIWSGVDAGYFAIESGPRMAAADRFEVEIEGVAGHGALPHETVDATIVAAAMTMNFQTLVSRETSSTDSLVVTVGRLESGTRFNVISGEAKLEGTVRYFTREMGENIVAMMDRVVQNTANMYRAKAKLTYNFFTTPVINEESSTQRARNAVTKLFGDTHLKFTEKETTAEDFSAYLDHKPGVFAFIGARNEAIGACYPHHNNYFNIDESVMKNGAALYAQYAVDFLNEEGA